jgi:hypothetical protein
MRSACTDLRGPVKNQSRGSCEGGYLRCQGGDKKFPLLAETESVLPVHIIGMKINLNFLPDDAIHVSSSPPHSIDIAFGRNLINYNRLRLSDMAYKDKKNTISIYKFQ